MRRKGRRGCRGICAPRLSPARLAALDARLILLAQRVARTVGTLVALARKDSPRKGADHVGLAKALTESLPCTLELLADGELSERRATLIAKETQHLSQSGRRDVDNELFTKLAGLGDRAVRDTARVTADRIDPAGARRRVQAARRAGFTAVYAEPDGTARLVARMPFEQALAVHRALHAEATKAYKREDETRRLGRSWQMCSPSESWALLPLRPSIRRRSRWL